MKRLLLAFGALCLLALSLTGIVLLVRSQRQTQAMQQFIAAGPANLAREEAAARQAGIPLTASELQQPLPPTGQNAAPLYTKLTKLLHDKPLGLPKYAEGMDAFHTYTPAQIAAVRRTLAARQDVMTLIHQAADKPHCVFVRDWSKGLALTFPEKETMREAARLLRTESYLLALGGHYHKAVANQAQSFRVADQAASDHVLLGYLVGIASEASGLGGLQGILAQAGSDDMVCNDVRRHVTVGRPHLALRDAMTGETDLACANFITAHQYEKYGLPTALREGFPEDGSSSTKSFNTIVSAEEQRQTHNTLDAWEADCLAGLIPLVRASDAPIPARRAAFTSVSREVEDDNAPTSVHYVSHLLLPMFSNIDESDTRIRAREAVTLVAAAILSAKSKTGVYPPKLPPGFTDPFTGKPLLYRREGSGFVVYSAGPTGHFDGGKPGEKAPGTETLFRYPAVPVPLN